MVFASFFAFLSFFAISFFLQGDRNSTDYYANRLPIPRSCGPEANTPILNNIRFSAAASRLVEGMWGVDFFNDHLIFQQSQGPGRVGRL